MRNEAVDPGTNVGGCRVQTYYQNTPAADESEFIESHENFDIFDGSQPGKKGSVLVTQTEDEIAAITMAIGAALAGARAPHSPPGQDSHLWAKGKDGQECTSTPDSELKTRPERRPTAHERQQRAIPQIRVLSRRSIA